MRNRFVDRDGEGNICGTYARPQREGHEKLPDDDPEVVAFETASKEAMDAAQQAEAADKAQLLADVAAMKARLDVLEGK